jgi:hypothetical protein
MREKRTEKNITKNKAYEDIAQSVKWWATSWTAWVRFPEAKRDISLLHSVQTGFGDHPASYSMDTGGFPQGLEVKNGGTVSPLLHVPSSHNAQLLKHRGNFTFYNSI